MSPSHMVEPCEMADSIMIQESRENMKKILLVLFMTLIVFVTYACFGEDTPNDQIDTGEVHDSPPAHEDTRALASWSQNRIIIDNNNRQFSYTSAIRRTVGPQDSFYGSDYLESAEGSAFVGTWEPSIEVAGYYKVYMMWPELENASERVRVEVTYEGGQNVDTTRFVNQTINGGFWVLLGTYYLPTGTGNHVTIYGEDGQVVYADAVQFELSLQIDEMQTEPPLEAGESFTPGSQVHVVKDQDGHYRLTVNGELYFIDGIAGIDELELMAEAGANTARTYSVAALEDGAVLDRAYELGIKIVIGIWLRHESAGFNYRDHPEVVEAQFEEVRAAVKKYRDHPALLGWAVGNEVDKSTAVHLQEIYEHMNDVARYIHEHDPYHPTIAMLAGSSPLKIGSLRRYVPYIDIIGINTYRHIGNVQNNIVGWAGPYLIGEYAMNQPMETQIRTDWGAIIEPDAAEKSDHFYNRYMTYIWGERDRGSIGGFAFKDTGSFRITHTWYGIVYDGMRTPQFYAKKAAWQKQPIEASIIIDHVQVDGRDQLESVRLETNEVYHVLTSIRHGGPDVTYHYEIRRDVGLAVNTVPSVLHEIEWIEDSEHEHGIYFRAPMHPDQYRLFVYAQDNQGNISTYSFPFLVEGEPFVLEDQEGVVVITTQDALGYEEFGDFSTSTNRPYAGAFTRFTRTAGDAARFSPVTLEEPGFYRVYYYNLSEGMGAYDDYEVQIDIQYASGAVETLFVNVTATAGGWINLGEFAFNMSGDEHVTITKIHSGTKVMRSTAVAFLPVD